MVLPGDGVEDVAKGVWGYAGETVRCDWCLHYEFLVTISHVFSIFDQVHGNTSRRTYVQRCSRDT